MVSNHNILQSKWFLIRISGVKKLSLIKPKCSQYSLTRKVLNLSTKYFCNFFSSVTFSVHRDEQNIYIRTQLIWNRPSPYCWFLIKQLTKMYHLKKSLLYYLWCGSFYLNSFLIRPNCAQICLWSDYPAFLSSSRRSDSSALDPSPDQTGPRPWSRL